MSLVENIRNVKLSDAAAIKNIYNYYIEHSPATFEEAVIDESEMANRISDIVANYPFLVLEINDQIVAYAYANTWKTRSAYRFSCESSVYVDHNELGKGYGRLIYTKLIDELKASTYKRIIAGISLPNPASVKLHEDLGFKYIGTFNKIGLKKGEWIDVGYWELHFD